MSVKKIDGSSNVAKITDDETRRLSLIESSVRAHREVGEVEESMNQNEKTGRTTDFDILKEFDPLFES